MLVVVNAGPVIWLAKIGRLDLLSKLYGQIFIPRQVYVECVSKGLEQGFRDAFIIKEACERSWIKVVELNETQSVLRREITLHLEELDAGEVEAIVYAKDRNADLILLDDATARSFAESWGLVSKGTLYVLLRAHRKGLLNIDETKELVYELVGKGFRIDPRLFAKLIQGLEK